MKHGSCLNFDGISKQIYYKTKSKYIKTIMNNDNNLL